ncbi:Uncharacterised protein [Bordetella pertussis]|nr:Uncharacterised protein [Bordetella pertussis]
MTVLAKKSVSEYSARSGRPALGVCPRLTFAHDGRYPPGVSYGPWIGPPGGRIAYCVRQVRSTPLVQPTPSVIVLCVSPS